jgi:hypothetical protein
MVITLRAFGRGFLVPRGGLCWFEGWFLDKARFLTLAGHCGQGVCLHGARFRLRLAAFGVYMEASRLIYALFAVAIARYPGS